MDTHPRAEDRSTTAATHRRLPPEPEAPECRGFRQRPHLRDEEAPPPTPDGGEDPGRGEDGRESKGGRRTSGERAPVGAGVS